MKMSVLKTQENIEQQHYNKEQNMPKQQSIIQECTKCNDTFSSYHESNLCSECSNAEAKEQYDAMRKRELERDNK